MSYFFERHNVQVIAILVLLHATKRLVPKYGQAADVLVEIRFDLAVIVVALAIWVEIQWEILTCNTALDSILIM